jgi:hypothetical protein
VTLYEPFGFQLRIGVRDRCAVYAQHGGQLAAGGNAVAGTQIASVHKGTQLIAQLNVKRNVTLRLEVYREHCLSP